MTGSLNAININQSGTYISSGSILTTSSITSATSALTSVSGGDMITLTTSATNARNTIKFVSDATTFELGTRGSTATNPNRLYIYNGSYRLLMNASGDTSLLSATASTSPTTGALIVTGGCGISGTTSLGGTVNVGTPTLGASSGQVNVKSSGYQLNLLNSSTYYTRLGTDSTGNLLLETNTAGGSGGFIVSTLSPSNSGSLFLGTAIRGTARIDLGAVAGNALFKLYQANNSSPSYMIGANSNALQITSGGSSGIKFNVYTGSTPESLGTNVFAMSAAGTATSALSLFANTGGVHAYGGDTTDCSSFGLGTHLDVSGGVGRCFSYDYSTSTAGDISIGFPNPFYIKANGVMGIGTSSPSGAALQITSFETSSITGAYGYLAGGGAGSLSNTGTVNVSLRCSDRIFAIEVDCSSDSRLKRNIRNVTEAEARALMSVSPVHFEWERTGEQSYGYIAQDVLKAGDFDGRHMLQDLVTTQDNPDMVESIDADGFVSPGSANFQISYMKVIPLLHKAISLQETKLAEMQREIDSLQGQIHRFLSLIALPASSPPKG